MKCKCTIEIEFDDQEMIDARERLNARRKLHREQFSDPQTVEELETILAKIRENQAKRNQNHK